MTPALVAILMVAGCGNRNLISSIPVFIPDESASISGEAFFKPSESKLSIELIDTNLNRNRFGTARLFLTDEDKKPLGQYRVDLSQFSKLGARHPKAKISLPAHLENAPEDQHYSLNCSLTYRISTGGSAGPLDPEVSTIEWINMSCVLLKKDKPVFKFKTSFQTGNGANL